MQGRKNYQEKLFTTFQLSDRIPADNLYRNILQVIDFQYVYSLTSKYYGNEGQASIDPIVFLKLMLVGYLENISSDRRIIHTASMRLDILFFIGYDIDEHLPWHSTLSRTRKLYGEEVFQSLFKQVLKQCIDKGMVSGKRQAVDSVLIKANASMESLLEKEILLDAEIYTKELDSNSDSPIKLNSPATKGKSNTTHYSPVDPEAKIATKPGKPYHLNYLGQLSVDTERHVITHAQAFSAGKRDSQCLKEIVEKTRDNLNASHLELEQVLADTNYSSTETLEALNQMNITGYIPNFGRYKPEREGFTYEKEQDRYVCPAGKYLNYKGLKNTRNTECKQYIASSKDCKECPLKESCIGKSNAKMITTTLSRPLFEEMDHRISSRYGKEMRRLRQSTVEPVIGTLVTYMGMKKVYTKGLVKANKCMIMAATAYNLKKLIKFKQRKEVLIYSTAHINTSLKNNSFCGPYFLG